METIAVYKEEQVKVYGITEKDDLGLVTIRFSAAQLVQWGLRICQLESYIERFELVTYHAHNKETTEFHLVFELPYLNPLKKALQRWTEAEQNCWYDVTYPVDLLYLHGPHFQDRYGIVDIAFNTLLKNNINILVSGCAGTSMYLAVPGNTGGDGRKILTETFLIPTSV